MTLFHERFVALPERINKKEAEKHKI